MLKQVTNNTTVIIVASIIILSVGFRLATISADTPPGLSWSAGLYVDEGYKTLAPRNLVMYDSATWHKADTYAGWLHMSPLTQWPVYASFKLFGTSIESARLVAILFFALLLLVYSALYKNRYSKKLYIIGLVLLTSDITIFTFSRIMLLEMPMSFLLYSTILAITLHYETKQPSIAPTALLVISAIVIAKTVKHTAIVYFLPAIIASISYYCINNRNIPRKQLFFAIAGTAIALVAILISTSHVWLPRINTNITSYAYHIVDNPLLDTSPLILIGAWLCCAVAFLQHPRYFLNNLYRLTLICVVIFTPLFLSIFSYNPMRYYSPVIPACILLVLEWIHNRNRFECVNNLPFTLIAITILTITYAFAFTALDLHNSFSMSTIVFGSSVLSFLTAITYRSISKPFSVVPALIVTGAILHNIYFLYNFHHNQTHNAEKLRQQLTAIVRDSKSIAGGWAPFLTLGTQLKSLYANDVINPPQVVKTIKPDYFMLSETPTSMATFMLLENDKDIEIGKPILLGSYNDTKVFLYPLSYIQMK